MYDADLQPVPSTKCTAKDLHLAPGRCTAEVEGQMQRTNFTIHHVHVTNKVYHILFYILMDMHLKMPN